MTERKDDRLWGGRFQREPNAQFDAFQRSFAFDLRLLPYEIAVDRAWAKALEPIGIFTPSEVKQTLAALDKIAERAKKDSAWFAKVGTGAEDVHHFVEKALVEELGPLGWKLHTGRSRNELIATDFRLFVIDAASAMQRIVGQLLEALLAQAKTYLDVPMAGMTLDPVPAHLVRFQRRVEALPEIDILDRLLVRRAPAVAFPVGNPRHDTVAQILTVGVDIDPARPLERLERRDRRHQLHAVIGGIELAAFEFLFAVAEREDRAPAPRTRIARAGAVGMHDDMRQGRTHGALIP